MKPEVKFYINGNDGSEPLEHQPVVTIREGKAPEIRDPVVVSVRGDIKTIRAFVNKRDNTDSNKIGIGSQLIDQRRAVAYVDRVQRSILLSLDPENPFGATVFAQLELSDEYLQFGINTTRMYKREEFEKLLRFTRLWFHKTDEYDGLMKGIQRFRAKTNEEVEQARDTRGNRTNNFERNVTSDDVPLAFTLNVPIFKGLPAKSVITVEVCFDIIDGGVKFWLESVAAAEIVQTETNALLDEELSVIENLIIVNV